MLLHRSGTKFEDMYWIDSENIRIITEEVNSTQEKKIIYSTSTENKIKDFEHIITIHSHPDSFPPSIEDLNSNYDHNYDLGIVVCHNGKVYMYAANEHISKSYYNLVVVEYLKQGYNEEEAQVKALMELQDNFDVNFKEVTDDDRI